MSTERGHIPPSFEEIGTGQAPEAKAKNVDFRRAGHFGENIGYGQLIETEPYILNMTWEELKKNFKPEEKYNSGNAPATRNFNPERLSAAPKREGTTNLGGNKTRDINNIQLELDRERAGNAAQKALGRVSSKIKKHSTMTTVLNQLNQSRIGR